jgi:DNA-binding FadR family transcriptional regulator
MMNPMEGSERRMLTEERTRRDGKTQWRPARFAAFVVDELSHQIIGGGLADGDVLPTEPALCEQFGFSRTVVREALKLLEQRGLVRVEQGRGTTVEPRSSWDLLDPEVLRIALAYDYDLSLLDDLISVRRVLEQQMAAAAAGRLTEAELEQLAGRIQEMESSYGDYERFREADNAFHAIIMRASGNEIGQTIVRVIHRYGGVTPPLATGASKANLRRTAAEHRGILDALAQGDGDLAGRRVAAHIEARWAERRVKRKGS